MSSEEAKLKTTIPVDDWAARAISEANTARAGRVALPAETQKAVSDAQATWLKLFFPTPKLEAWRYTNPDPIAKGGFVLPSGDPCESDLSDLLSRALVDGYSDASLLVFVDGVFSERYSKLVREDGVAVERINAGATAAARIGDLGQHRDDAFAALATALLSDCVCITVRSENASQTPIQIVHLVTKRGEGVVITPRIHVHAERNASVTVIESHLGEAGVRYLSLPIVELSADSGARIDYYKIQLESEKAFHVSGVTAVQQRDSEIRSHIFAFGGALSRNNAQVLLKGSGAQAVLNGLSLLNDDQHVDNSTLIHHIEPNSESREHFKGIYGGASKGVFSGTITVEKIAQKTNAFQSNQALLLSTEASIEARPQLKIWADDVKCTHGATVGQLDADAMFYLRSRGVGERDAKAFLVRAFASEVVLSVNSAPVRQHLEGLIEDKLGKI